MRMHADIDALYLEVDCPRCQGHAQAKDHARKQLDEIEEEQEREKPTYPCTNQETREVR